MTVAHHFDKLSGTDIVHAKGNLVDVSHQVVPEGLGVIDAMGTHSSNSSTGGRVRDVVGHVVSDNLTNKLVLESVFW